MARRYKAEGGMPDKKYDCYSGDDVTIAADDAISWAADQPDPSRHIQFWVYDLESGQRTPPLQYDMTVDSQEIPDDPYSLDMHVKIIAGNTSIYDQAFEYPGGIDTEEVGDAILADIGWG